jgi:hypothetical protein
MVSGSFLRGRMWRMADQVLDHHKRPPERPLHSRVTVLITIAALLLATVVVYVLTHTRIAISGTFRHVEYRLIP